MERGKDVSSDGGRQHKLVVFKCSAGICALTSVRRWFLFICSISIRKVSSSGGASGCQCVVSGFQFLRLPFLNFGLVTSGTSAFARRQMSRVQSLIHRSANFHCDAHKEIDETKRITDAICQLCARHQHKKQFFEPRKRKQCLNQHG